MVLYRQVNFHIGVMSYCITCVANRQHQAKVFNYEPKFNVIVATDAIGMGVNL